MEIYGLLSAAAGRWLGPAALLVLLMVPGIPGAQEESEGNLYRWEDEEGTVTFSSSPPPEGVDATIIEVPPPLDDDSTQQEMERRLDALNELAEPVQMQESAAESAEPTPQEQSDSPVESDEVMQERSPEAP